MVRKSISLSEDTYNELTNLGNEYKESMDNIVSKCVQAYKKLNKLWVI